MIIDRKIRDSTTVKAVQIIIIISRGINHDSILVIDELLSNIIVMSLDEKKRNKCCMPQFKRRAKREEYNNEFFNFSH
jgi:hypothetical protein